jgi:peroxiredoxin
MKKTILSCLFSCFAIVNSFATDPAPLSIGSSAPDFLLPATDGKTYTLDDFKDYKVLTIIFTCNHCPTAQAYEERIKQMVVDYKEKGAAIIAISPNDPLSVRLDEMGYTDLGDSFEDMKVRAKDMQFNFPYLYDGETSATSLKYGPQATPHVFVFDKDRKLRYTGRIDDGEKPGTAKTHDTRNAIEALLNDKSLAVEKTKTFGCSTKWPDKRDYANAAIDEWAKEKVTIEELKIEEMKALLANAESKNYRLINVWATWCGPCVTEFPHFVDINRMYRNREFELITISLDDIGRKPNALTFLTRKQASMKNLIFNGDRYDFIDALDKKWEGSLPYTILVAPGGKILYSKQGVINPLEMKKIIVSAVGRIY